MTTGTSPSHLDPHAPSGDGPFDALREQFGDDLMLLGQEGHQWVYSVGSTVRTEAARASQHDAEPTEHPATCRDTRKGPTPDRFLAELCREVTERGHPKLVERAYPLHALAIPFSETAGHRVAVLHFLAEPCRSKERLFQMAQALGMHGPAAVRWIAALPHCQPELIERLAAGAMKQVATAQRASKLHGELDDLASQLAHTYEELSLLYKICGNLKISQDCRQLGRSALEWLDELVGAEALALLLVEPEAGFAAPNAESRRRESLIVQGDVPLDAECVHRLAAQLGRLRKSPPLVCNDIAAMTQAGEFPGIREAILVPLEDGGHFGWLGAFNSTEERKFGTVEATLLGSIASILATHACNLDLYQQHEDLLVEVVRALVSAIDAKDPYTCGHSERVALIARSLAQQVGLSDGELRIVYLSGLLHDIGKIGIDDHVLHKEGELTEAEYDEIKRHVEIGYGILRRLRKLRDVLPGVRHHHEAYDGSGYPDGLAGEEIPLLARILAVADAYDAMGSDRPYRKGLPSEVRDEILRRGAGKQWAADLVDAFFQCRNQAEAICEGRTHTPDIQEYAAGQQAGTAATAPVSSDSFVPIP